MGHLILVRAWMGSSFVFHLVYTAIGIGLPLMWFIAEGLALRLHYRTFLNKEPA